MLEAGEPTAAYLNIPLRAILHAAAAQRLPGHQINRTLVLWERAATLEIPARAAYRDQGPIEFATRWAYCRRANESYALNNIESNQQYDPCGLSN